LNETFVSIIVPCSKVDRYAEECVTKCLNELEYKNFEILIIPDKYFGELDHIKDPRLKIVESGNVAPGKKRNIGMSLAKGEVFAFIDSDAYPKSNWLNEALKVLQDADIVGGPAITPEEDSERQKASGYVYSSIFMGGLSKRFAKKSSKIEEVDMIHSVNCIAKRGIIESVGGWDERYWPGEDTLLCGLLRKKGIKLYHDDDLMVYHHRRPLYIPHLKQVSRFGLYRGFLVKKYGKEFFRPIYFLPMIFVIYLIFGAISFTFSTILFKIFVATLISYLAILFFVTMKEVNERNLILMVFSGILLTHIVYGIQEIKGLIFGVEV